MPSIDCTDATSLKRKQAPNLQGKDMDDIDFGSELAEKHNELSLQRVRSEAAKGGLVFKGQCYNPLCEEPLEDRNFCNAQCRDEYDYYLKRGR